MAKIKKLKKLRKLKKYKVVIEYTNFVGFDSEEEYIIKAKTKSHALIKAKRLATKYAYNANTEHDLDDDESIEYEITSIKEVYN